VRPARKIAGVSKCVPNPEKGKKRTTDKRLKNDLDHEEEGQSNTQRRIVWTDRGRGKEQNRRRKKKGSIRRPETRLSRQENFLICPLKGGGRGGGRGSQRGAEEKVSLKGGANKPARSHRGETDGLRRK